ncbi:MAG: hypothetical protein WBC75_09425 [Dehalococcoidales bacterium]
MIDKLMLLFLLLARSHLTTRFAMRNTRYASRNAFHAVALVWLTEVGAPGGPGMAGH